MSKRSVKQYRFTTAPQTFAWLSLSVVAVLTSFALAASASATTASLGWEVESRVYPTNLKPGGIGTVIVQMYNTGAGSSNGAVTLTDILPPGLEAVEAGPTESFGAIGPGSIEFNEEANEEDEIYEEKHEYLADIGAEQLREWNCSGNTVVTCTTGVGAPSLREPKLGPIMRPIRPGYAGRIAIVVKAVGSSGTGANRVAVSGGGAPTAETSTPVMISPATAGFGIAGFNGWFSNVEGKPDMQAGSHPYDLTLNFSVNSAEKNSAGGSLRDVTIALPPGVVGDPHAVPQCPHQRFFSALAESCPPDTQVGVDRPGIEPGGEEGFGDFELRNPVYNLVPPPGVPAEFGFEVQGTPIVIEAGVRSGSDYGISGSVHDLAYKAVFNNLTLWGVPGEESHRPERCGTAWEQANDCGEPIVGSVPKPLLTLPTSCEGPLTARITADSWTAGDPVAHASLVLHDPTGTPVGLSGCEQLGFSTFLSVAPDTSFADTPAGLTVDLKVPQDGLQAVERLATSNIKDTTVTLPEGVAINPGQAAGLGACGPAEDGLTTEAEKAGGEEDNGPAHCPNNAKVGTDEIETPLLSKPLKGSVYVMPTNPPHLQLLVTAEGEGVFLKLVGDVHLNEQTGQLVTTFSNTPELPFTDFKLSFSGGAQAALTTPVRCGTYNTTTDFTAWSSPFVADLSPTSNFQIAGGTGGVACPPSPLPFSPSMIAGSTTDQAGGFTDFSLLLTRPDDQQRIQGLQFKTPEGLLGMISRVPLCPEAQANAGACSSASQIGHTVVEAGPGPYPLVVPQPGQSPAPIYLTEGYKGAPYGLSIVVPLHVGPFTLQTQIVRAKIEVDPLTTQLTITTDPLPTIIDGIPADLRAINAVIDKPGFMFNPTGCEPGSFSGTATSTEGASVPIGSHFQMGSCRALTFKPNFKVSTSGKTSRKDGASLDAKILYPTGALGDNQASSQSNVKAVKVDLPKQLPSRLTTLQKACPSTTFEVNPAACPEDSKVGTATAITPVLPVTLTGPAYFVSYGGAKFPELVIVLQGYGVTVYLHGETFISKAGITSSTFRKVPDVPITSFELKLPEGPYSALAANGNLCTTKLAMPTAFTGQNGAVLKQSTPISVTGCSKHKATKAKKKSKNSGKGNAHNHNKKK
jgi:hypothetical protein